MVRIHVCLQMKKIKANYWLILGTVLGVIFLLIFGFNLLGGKRIGEKNSIIPFPQSVQIEGQIVCLPHKNKSVPQTTKCAYGLQDKNNQYYNLLGLNQQDLISGKITTGQKMMIEGTLVTEKDDKYDIVGTINVTSIK